jgi:hypothetical protein
VDRTAIREATVTTVREEALIELQALALDAV